MHRDTIIECFLMQSCRWTKMLTLKQMIERMLDACCMSLYVLYNVNTDTTRIEIFTLENFITCQNLLLD